MLIGAFDLALRPLLIAEIGNNHEGDPQHAVELTEAAIEAGADAVKIQIIEPSKLVNIAEVARIAQLSRFRLAPDVLADMASRVRRRGRLFMASVFDCATLKVVQDGLDAIKIASGDLNFDPLLDVAARSGKPVVLSTGMARMDEIKHAVQVIAAGIGDDARVADRLAVLHCVSLYPTPLDQANLGAIPRLARALGVTVGYSDHTLGIDQAVLSLALGARIVEKHFTLDKARSSFRDHALSADPAEFQRLAQVVHAYNSIVGTGESDAERGDTSSRAIVRRSIVAARVLPVGAIIEENDLDFVRPANGLPPSEAKDLVGRRLTRSLLRHQVVHPSDFE